MRSKLISRPAPIKGLVLGQSAKPDKDGAEVLENFIPTRRGIRIRGGRVSVADLGSPVRSLMTYRTGGVERAFAATSTDLYEVPSGSPSSLKSGLTSGDWSHVQFGVVGGQYLILANGSDPVQLYDGSSFTDANYTFDPVGILTHNLSYVWSYRNRLFFSQKGTLKVWFGDVASVTGTLRDFDLSGVFELGGSILFGATISYDAGDGIDDRCVIVSDQGEVAIYAGADPANDADWRLEGRYRIGIPLGPHAHMRAGGDVLILTQAGAISLSQAIRSDKVALTSKAITAPIEPLWTSMAKTRTAPWTIRRWDDRGIAIVTMPGSDRVLTVSLDTGAWSVQTNWPVTSMTTFGSRMLAAIGSQVWALDESGLDGSDPFVARCAWSFAGDGVSRKIAGLARVVYYGRRAVALRLGAASDHMVTWPDPPAATSVTDDPDAWDVGTWDNARWAASTGMETRTVVSRWARVRASGIALAPTIQITSGSPVQLRTEIVAVEMTVESGGVVV